MNTFTVVLCNALFMFYNKYDIISVYEWKV